MSTDNPTVLDWKTHARRWEARSKEHAAESAKYKAMYEAEKAQGRAWRSAYHSLRISIEERLDRIATVLEDTEWTDDSNTDTTTTTKEQ